LPGQVCDVNILSTGVGLGNQFIPSNEYANWLALSLLSTLKPIATKNCFLFEEIDEI
tara:strand:+ start:391 stop:561 length:171 start_codon:yes stop_codon:yes gene_type:complete